MTKLSSIIVLVLTTAVLQLTPTREANAGGFWDCDSSRLTSFWEEDIAGNELSGKGTVCVTPFGLWSTMQVRGLTAGNAYTTWWVYIDDPASCANFPLPVPDPIPFPEPESFAGPCGLADFFTMDPSGEFLNPLAVFGRMDSVVAKESGRTRFSGDLRDFKPSSGSQVWLFMFGHGPADQSDKRQLARQLLTPEDPGSGVPHVGIEGRPYGYPAGVVVINIP
jgi:hypothetical protein